MPAAGVFSLIWLLIALPLFGAAVLLLGGRRTNSWGPYLGVLTVVGSAVLAVVMVVAGWFAPMLADRAVAVREREAALKPAEATA